jgi:hypothetical protein
LIARCYHSWRARCGRYAAFRCPTHVAVHCITGPNFSTSRVSNPPRRPPLLAGTVIRTRTIGRTRIERSILSVACDVYSRQDLFRPTLSRELYVSQTPIHQLASEWCTMQTDDTRAVARRSPYAVRSYETLVHIGCAPWDSPTLRTSPRTQHGSLFPAEPIMTRPVPIAGVTVQGLSASASVSSPYFSDCSQPCDGTKLMLAQHQDAGRLGICRRHGTLSATTA